MAPMSLPNFITIGRILLVPLAVWLIISEAYGLAFLTFVVAGVSDGVDGYIARRYDARTELGAYLDPVADKALLVSVFVTLGLIKIVPAWLVILVVSRDVLIVGAFILSWLMDHRVEIKPSIASKINTAFQIIFVVGVLAAAALDFQKGLFFNIGMALVAASTILSGSLYLREWIGHMAGGGKGKHAP